MLFYGRKEKAGEALFNWHMKKWLMIAALLACLAAGRQATAAYAYLADRDTAVNKVSLGTGDIHVQEEFTRPADPEPGAVIPKKPCVSNDSRIPVFVRMAVRFSDSEGEAQCEPLAVSSRWTLMEDGYYYYGQAVPAGQKTELLFENVVLKASVPKEELRPFDVLVYAEAVQAYGHETAQSAFAAL